MRKIRKQKESSIIHWYCGTILPDGEICRRMLHTEIKTTRKQCDCGGFMVELSEKQLAEHRAERRQHLMSCHRNK